MNTITRRLLMTLGLVAALAMPGSALARHGADDLGETEQHASVVEPGDDNGGATENEAEHVGGDDTGQRHAARGPRRARMETYVLRGTLVSVDAAAETVVVEVKKANHGRRGRALRGKQLTLDLSAARVKIGDMNGDGTADLGDATAGDRVEVQVRLPRPLPADLSEPFAAKRFKDRSARPAHADDDS